MVGFSSEIGAALVAEGIETEAELAAVTKLGMAAAQGYLLGRPVVHGRTEANQLPSQQRDCPHKGHRPSCVVEVWQLRQFTDFTDIPSSHMLWFGKLDVQ